MNTQHAFTLGSLFCVASLMVATSAQAYPGNHFGRGDRMNATTDRSGTYQRLNGGSGTFNQSVTRAPGNFSGSTTWTNAQGSTGGYSFDNTWNKSTGTGTHESSTTYADGKASSSQGDWTKSGSGKADYTGTHTGVNGQTTDVSKSVSDANGVKTIVSTYTNPTTGKSATVGKTITGSDGSKQVDTTATGPNGKTSTDNRDVSYVKNSTGEITRTANGSVTGPNGPTKNFGNTETYTKTVTPNSTSTTLSTPTVD